MFPHVPLQAITLDLVDTHSVSLTVDHILTHSIYIPGQDNNNNNNGNNSIQGEGLGEPDAPLETPESSSEGEEEEDDDDENFVHAIMEHPRDHERRFSPHHLMQPGSRRVSGSEQGRREGLHEPQYEHASHLIPDSGLLSCDTEAMSHDLERTSCDSGAVVHDLDQSSCDAMEISRDNEEPSCDNNDSQESSLLRNVELGSGNPQQATLFGGLRQRNVERRGLENMEATKMTHSDRAESEGQEVEVSSLSNVTLFSSLQERKAELLRKARRYLLLMCI